MSITYETPGVYIEEITGPGVIQGVSTSVAGFVGPTARGTSTEAVQVTSFEQFMERFTVPGDAHLYDDSEEPVYLSFALQGFFQNGGRRAHIARVSNGAAASVELPNDAGGVEAIVRARVEGTDGNQIRVQTQPSTRQWTLAAPTATIAGTAPPAPGGGLPQNDPQVLDLGNPSGFAVDDNVQIMLPPAAPFADNPGDQRSAVGSPVSLPLVVSATSGVAVTFTPTNLPAGLTIDAAGRITGTPTTPGLSNVTVAVSDGTQATTVAFDWDVFEPVPIVTSPGRQSTAVGTLVSLQIQAQSQSVPPGTLSYAAPALPTGLAIDVNTGLITGTPTTAGVTDVTVSVTEGTATAAARFAWVVDPPTVPVVDNPGDQRSTTGSTVSLQVVAAPVTPGDVLQYAQAGLPAGLTLDASSGQITGQPTGTGTANVTVTVTDPGTNTSTATFDWTVVDPTPTVTNPGRQATNIGEAVTLQIVAQAPAGTTAAFAATGLPAGLAIDTGTGTISGAPTTAGVSDVAVTVTAGGATTVRFTWVTPAPIFASVERVEQQWIRVVPPAGVDAPTGWPGAVQQATISLVDYAPDQDRVRLELPTPPLQLPDVGTWVEAGSGADLQTFRVRRVASTGVVTIDRRPLGVDLSLRLHRNLTSLSFDLLVTAPSGASTAVSDVSLDPISDRYLLAEGFVPGDLVVVEEPPLPLFALPRRIGTWSAPLANGARFDVNALGSEDYRRAIALLERVDEVSMVCVPDAARYDEGRRVTRRTIQAAQLGHCLRMSDRIAVFDPPQTPPDGERPEDQIGNVINDLRSTRGFGAVYYPWLRVQDPRSTAQRPLTMLIPPSGHIAGVIARIDLTRGVFKAPANVTIDEVLGVEQKLTDSEQAPLNVAGVNVLRILPGSNRVTVWGARTTVDPFVTDWLYLNVRRLLLFLEESIQDGIRWAVFEPNDLGLWKSLHRVITAFLREQWRAGALFGATEEEAFRVRIDEALNPPSTRNKGYLYIEIKVAPVRPAEFVVVRISLFDGGTDVEEV
jgi:phage tail sheath protein FI